MAIFVNLADLRPANDPEGRTYRQINAAKQHTIPIGALVELESGARLFVVFHGRDCDMTPLYYLCVDETDTVEETPGFRNRRWTGGFPADSLRVVGRS